jgi:hypothetical protein
MSLSERHRWCIKKILEAFASDLEADTVQTFMRNDATLQKFTSFFHGDGAGRLFVLYQPASVPGEVMATYHHIFCLSIL